MTVHFPRREEIATSGFDPFRQLAPDAFGMPASSGILLPMLPGVTYRVLLAVADLDVGDRVIGLRQYLDLVAYLLTTGPARDPGAPIYPLRQPVESPFWRLIDGGDTWTLTRQPKTQLQRLQGPLDMDSFRWRDTDGPALVYETARFPAAPLLPGYLGLDAYTPPNLIGQKLLAVRDRRWPWTKQATCRLNYPCESPERFRFYCDVTQSDPSTRNQPTINVADGYSLPPEEGFLQQTQSASAIYGWVAGAILIKRGRKSRAARCTKSACYCKEAERCTSIVGA